MTQTVSGSTPRAPAARSYWTRAPRRPYTPLMAEDRTGLTVAVGEEPPGERRVALVPDSVRRLTGSKLSVVVLAGAGAGASISDAQFAEAGATILPADELYAAAD